jgi:hypothetical protein
VVERWFTDWYATFKHLEPDVSPFAYWLQIDTAIDQRLCQISTSGAECVRPDGNGTRNFICIEEFDGLFNRHIQVLHIRKSGRHTSAIGKSWNNFSARMSLYP